MILIMSNKIKELRVKQELTQKQFSEQIHIPVTTLAQYERGEREPKLETWQKLADFFNVPVPYIQGIQKFKNVDEYAQELDIVRNIRNHAFNSDDKTTKSLQEYAIRSTELSIDAYWQQLKTSYPRLLASLDFNDKMFDSWNTRQKLKLVQVVENLIIQSSFLANSSDIDSFLDSITYVIELETNARFK